MQVTSMSRPPSPAKRRSGGKKDAASRAEMNQRTSCEYLPVSAISKKAAKWSAASSHQVYGPSFSVYRVMLGPLYRQIWGWVRGGEFIFVHPGTDANHAQLSSGVL